MELMRAQHARCSPPPGGRRPRFGKLQKKGFSAEIGSRWRISSRTARNIY